MKHIKLYEQYLDALNEAELSLHYKEQMDLRIGPKFKVTSVDGAPVSAGDVKNRTVLLINHLNDKLKSMSLTLNEPTVVNFGDILIKHDGKVYKPTFSVPKTQETDKTYTGSVMCAICIDTRAVTIKVFPRTASEKMIMDDVISHTIRRTESDGQSKARMIYLDKKVNVIDMDVTFDKFAEMLGKDDGPKTTSIQKETKEMVLSKGTTVKFYGIDKVLKSKTIDRTERTTEGQLKMYFSDRSFKTFKKEDVFIVTPANDTQRDEAKKNALGLSGSNYVGRIYDIGTYNKPGRHKTDYVRIWATELF